MTIEYALHAAAAGLDVYIEEARRRFEQSLVDNRCPPEDVEDLREAQREHMASWRRHTLDVMFEDLRDWLHAQCPRRVH